MIQSFKSFIKKEKLFNVDNHILLAVSGGVDSVVMTGLFESSGFNYAIAHCNFHLRGKESDKDAMFVESIAKEKNVAFYLKDFETKSYAATHKISIQMAARELRFNWFEKLIKEQGYSFYATAHQQDDQIETFFINMIRGTGISGLHGILPKQGNLIHPMLFTNRKDIENFAAQNKILYRTDSSNNRTDYTRNKIRNVLLPIINEINPEYVSTFTSNIERFRQAELIYYQRINFLAKNLISKNDNRITISIRGLDELEPKETLLFELISPYGFNFSDIKNIVNALQKPSGQIFKSKSHTLYKDREYLVIEPENFQTSNREVYQIDSGNTQIKEPLRLTINIRESNPVINFNTDKNNACFDADKVTFPLKLRKWEKGDFFYPLGMENRKLLSDYFIDNKISLPDKEKAWILTSEDQIIWIVGHRIDNRFKISSSTRNELKIQVLE
jgi:tRNA(Ile)-lysidine synthase